VPQLIIKVREIIEEMTKIMPDGGNYEWCSYVD
jgi:hypothetical protein